MTHFFRFSSLFILLLTQITPRNSHAQEFSGDQLEMMKNFGKIYAELRYFYPDDALTPREWDLVLVRGLNMTEHISPDQFNDSVTAFFQPFTPGIKISEKGKLGLKRFNRVRKDDLFWQYRGYSEGAGFYNNTLVNKAVVPDNDPPGFIHWIDKKPVLENSRIEISCSARSLSGNNSLRIGASIYNYTDKKDSLNTKEYSLFKEWNRIVWEDDYNQGSSFISLFAGISGDGSIQLKDITMKIFINDSLYHTEPFELNKTSPERIARTTLNRPFGYSYTINRQENYLQISKIKKLNSGWLFETWPKGSQWKRVRISDKSWLCYPVSASYKKYQRNHNDSLGIHQNLSHINYDLVVANRIASVIKIYCIVNRFFPYKNQMKLEPESLLDTYLEKINQCKSESDCLNTILLMTAELNDGHCYVDHPLRYPERCAEADFGWYDNQLRVIGTSENCPLQIGDIVLHIDDVSAKTYLQQRCIQRSGSIQWKELRETLVFSCGDSSQITNYHILRNDGELELTLPVRRTGFAGSTVTPKFNAFEIVADSIAYIDLSRYDYSNFQKFADTLLSLKGLIVDLREYPRMFPEFLGHFTDSVLYSANWETPAITASDKTAFDLSGKWEINPAYPRAKCTTVFLTGSGTISYGESLTDIIDHYHLGTTIGQTTSGANGNKTSFRAPGGYLIYFTGMQVRRRDGSPLFAKGIKPMVFHEAKWQSEGDETVEFAIQFIQNSRTNPK